MNTFNTFQDKAFEPCISAEGYLVFRDEQGGQAGHCTSDWPEDVFPNVIQEAIFQTRGAVLRALQEHFQVIYPEEQQSLAMTAALGPRNEMVWAENAPQLELQGREVLKELQQAKRYLQMACIHLQCVAELEPTGAEC